MIETLEAMEKRHAGERKVNAATRAVLAKFAPEEPSSVFFASHYASVSFKKPDMASALTFLYWLKAKDGIDASYLIKQPSYSSVVSEFTKDPAMDLESDNATRYEECIELDIGYHGDGEVRLRHYTNTLKCFVKGIRVSVEIGTDMFGPKPIQPEVQWIGGAKSRLSQMFKAPLDGYLKHVTWNSGGDRGARHSYYFPGLDVFKAAVGSPA